MRIVFVDSVLFLIVAAAVGIKSVSQVSVTCSAAHRLRVEIM
jgi:hypothetical protein